MPNENTISCAFCGSKFSFPDNPGRPNKVEATPELRAHIEVCGLHPYAKALERIRELEEELAELRKESDDGMPIHTSER